MKMSQGHMSHLLWFRGCEGLTPLKVLERVPRARGVSPVHVGGFLVLNHFVYESEIETFCDPASSFQIEF